jgi:5-hydroxyisourate hydrolase
MGRLAASVLDSVNGRPAAGVRIELYRIDSGSRVRVAATQTNAIGRTEPALMEGDNFRTGRYELEFALAEYLRHAAGRPTVPAGRRAAHRTLRARR